MFRPSAVVSMCTYAVTHVTVPGAFTHAMNDSFFFFFFCSIILNGRIVIYCMGYLVIVLELIP